MVRRSFSLSFFSVPDLDPIEAIDIAAQAGYDHVGLRPVRPRPGAAGQDILGNARLLGEIAAHSHAKGVGVLDLEFLWIGEDFDPGAWSALGEAGQQLGARAILAGGNDADMSRLADNYAMLCAEMGPYGLQVSIECISYAPIASIPDAMQLIACAGHPANAGLLVDTLHFSRARSSLSELAAVPPALFHSAQICDAPAEIPATHEAILATALGGRLLPGEGGLDLPGMVACLPPHIPLSLEIPNPVRCAQVGAAEWARLALDAARTLS